MKLWWDIIPPFCTWTFLLSKSSLCMIEITTDNSGSRLRVNSTKSQIKWNQINNFDIPGFIIQSNLWIETCILFSTSWSQKHIKKQISILKKFKSLLYTTAKNVEFTFTKRLEETCKSAFLSYSWSGMTNIII